MNVRYQGDLLPGFVLTCITVLFTACFGLNSTTIIGIINIEYEKSVMALHL